MREGKTLVEVFAAEEARAATIGGVRFRSLTPAELARLDALAPLLRLSPAFLNAMRRALIPAE